jgi:hypothetical protein
MWIEINGYGEDSVGISDGMSEYNKIWSVNDLNGWLKPEFQIHDSNTLNESDDEWSVDAPKDWDSFDIEIRMSNQYRFYNGENGQNEYLDEVKLVKTNSDELIKYFGSDIPHDSSQIEDLLYDKYFEDDDLQDFINQGETIEEIPDEFYGRDWDSDWDDVEFDVKIIDNTMNALCRPGFGPMRDGVNVPRNDPLIQRDWYNGWKKLHGMKWQTIDLPNGMNFHVFGPVSVRHRNIYTLITSDINELLRQLQLNEHQ